MKHLILAISLLAASYAPSQTVTCTGTLPATLPANVTMLCTSSVTPPPTNVPVVSLTSSLAFGSQAVGTTSALGYATLTNTGGATLTISSNTISGPFAWGNLGTCGTSLVAGAKCTYSATFTPTVVGAASGQITITDNAAGSPHVVVLTGTGSGTPPPPPPPPPPNGGTIAAAYASYITKYSSYTKQVTVTPSTFSSSLSQVGAGVVMWLTPGTYALPAGFSTSASGTSAAHAAYVSTVYGGAKLVASSGGNGTAAWIEKGSYTEHAGFDITNPNGCEGFYGGGPTGGVYVYNVVHDIANGSQASSGGWCPNGTGGGGIEPGTNHGTIANNIVYNIGYPGNEWVHGLYIGGGNMQIFNNVVWNASGACIQDYNNSENDVIVNNTLVACGTFGITLGAESCGSGSGGDYVANNIFDANATKGNIETYCGSGSITGNTYTNNLNYGSGAILVPATNTISANPSFVNLASPAAGGNFALQPGSPAIGAATPTNAPAVNILGVKTGNQGAY